MTAHPDLAARIAEEWAIDQHIEPYAHYRDQLAALIRRHVEPLVKERDRLNEYIRAENLKVLDADLDTAGVLLAADAELTLLLAVEAAARGRDQCPFCYGTTHVSTCPLAALDEWRNR